MRPGLPPRTVRPGRRAGWLAVPTALALLAGAGGCYRNSLIVDRSLGDGERRERDLSFFLAGLIGVEEIDLDAVCPHGVAQFGDEATVLDSFLGIITLAIYTPRTAFFECARPGAASRAAPVRPGPWRPAAGGLAGEDQPAAPRPVQAASDAGTTSDGPSNAAIDLDRLTSSQAPPARQGG